MMRTLTRTLKAVTGKEAEVVREAVTGVQDEVTTKQCIGCAEVKSTTEFYKKKDGLQPYCKPCDSRGVREREARRRGTFREKCSDALKDSRKATKKAARITGREIENTLSYYQVLFTLGGDECAYCESYLAQSEKTLDHIIPMTEGGSNTFDNIALACTSCNSTKKNKPPLDFLLTKGNVYATQQLIERVAIRKHVAYGEVIEELGEQASAFHISSAMNRLAN